jgi:hypothetical protein
LLLEHPFSILILPIERRCHGIRPTEQNKIKNAFVVALLLLDGYRFFANPTAVISTRFLLLPLLFLGYF